ncbi:hypothetical protein DUI87_34608 [Hirundo rustica rustica]|uniref:Retroviral nucleocapsid Gag protein p24 C-terminal domain-containing protein n=1 Tax=Hirundo rustica rustica TaxID=333673 RepID=A0A3M0IKV7_HIRRU|nr:hypothetical protein DUI87_34608 [Hirundo rustica rustica]
MNLQLVGQRLEEQGQWWLGEPVGMGLQHQDTGNVLMVLGGKNNFWGLVHGIWPRLKRDRRWDGRSPFGPLGQLAKREQPGTGNEEERRRGTTHNTYQPLAWQALTELRDAVGKYDLSSAEVMQILRYFNASLLTPFDIRSLARALFPPVEYDFFENKWTQLAGRTVEQNRTLGQGDPRHMVNIDMLMGTGNYTRAEGQAGYEPLVQEQCQQTGMAALVQTLQLATPQQSFAMIVQGVDEPFLCFAGRLTAAVEKQVSDPAARKLMIQSLAQGNCNAVCKRIIEALPREPSMSDMVGACAKVYRIEPSIDVTVFITTPDLIYILQVSSANGMMIGLILCTSWNGSPASSAA